MDGDDPGLARRAAAGGIHQDEIEVLSWSFGVSHDAGTSGSTRSGTTEFDGLVITKVVDVATPKLLEGCATGTTFPEAIITLQRSVGGASKTYLVIKLTGATVSSVSISGTGGEDRPTESASLNFTAIEMTYSQYKSDGSLAGNVVMSYDLSANTP